MSIPLLFVLISLCFLNSDVEALKCYSCGAVEGTLDQRCIDDPASLEDGVRKCDMEYCISIRVEYHDPKDKVQSIFRQCNTRPLFMNQYIDDPTFRTYYKACQTDLCNGGSGKDFSGIGGLVGDSGDATVLLVPGIGVNTALSISCNAFLVAIIAILILKYNF